MHETTREFTIEEEIVLVDRALVDGASRFNQEPI
jgi:hypothetical protein